MNGDGKEDALRKALDVLRLLLYPNATSQRAQPASDIINGQKEQHARNRICRLVRTSSVSERKPSKDTAGFQNDMRRWGPRDSCESTAGLEIFRKGQSETVSFSFSASPTNIHLGGLHLVLCCSLENLFGVIPAISRPATRSDTCPGLVSSGNYWCAETAVKPSSNPWEVQGAVAVRQ